MFLTEKKNKISQNNIQMKTKYFLQYLAGSKNKKNTKNDWLKKNYFGCIDNFQKKQFKTISDRIEKLKINFKIFVK